MKKLQKIIHYHYEKKHKSVKYAGKSRKEVRNLMIEAMISEDKNQYVQDRLRGLGITLAFRCAIMGDEMGLRNELKQGFPVNRRSSETGRCVLHEAAAGGHFPIVKMLLGEYKADVKIRTMLGYATALHLAVEMNYRQIASLLLTYGSDVDAADRRGVRAIHRVKSEPMLKLLLRYNVDITAKTNEGLGASAQYLKYVRDGYGGEGVGGVGYLPELATKLEQLEEEAYKRKRREEESELLGLLAGARASLQGPSSGSGSGLIIHR